MLLWLRTTRFAFLSFYLRIVIRNSMRFSFDHFNFSACTNSIYQRVVEEECKMGCFFKGIFLILSQIPCFAFFTAIDQLTLCFVFFSCSCVSLTFFLLFFQQEKYLILRSKNIHDDIVSLLVRPSRQAVLYLQFLEGFIKELGDVEPLTSGLAKLKVTNLIFITKKRTKTKTKTKKQNGTHTKNKQNK